MPARRNVMNTSPLLVSTVVSFRNATGAKSECMVPASLWVLRTSEIGGIEDHRERLELCRVEVRWLPAETEQQPKQDWVSRLKPPRRREHAEDHDAECQTPEQHEHAHAGKEPRQEEAAIAAAEDQSFIERTKCRLHEEASSAEQPGHETHGPDRHRSAKDDAGQLPLALAFRKSEHEAAHHDRDGDQSGRDRAGEGGFQVLRGGRPGVPLCISSSATE